MRKCTWNARHSACHKHSRNELEFNTAALGRLEMGRVNRDDSVL